MTIVRSRLTGQTHSILPERAVSGEFSVIKPFHANGVMLEVGEYVLANVHGKVSTGATTVDWSSSAVSEQGLQRLRATSLHCQAMHGQSAGAWLAVSPMTPDLNEQAELLSVEKVLEMTLDGLEDICLRPRTVLAAEERLLPITKVRRSSHRALSHLAAHPEHWLRPTAHNVQPSHLLASIRDESFAIYENKAAVKLLTRLDLHLTERITGLEKLKAKVAVFGDFSEVARRGTYGRQRRLFTLWAEVSADDPAKFALRLDNVIDRLKALRRRVNRCQNSRLYAALRRMPVERNLRITNIFRNEGRYRKVARLWEALNAVPKLGQGAAQQAADLQVMARGFAAYSALLVGRALRQLGYMPESDRPWGRGLDLSWSSESEHLHLHWSDDDVLELMDQGQVRLRIVPLLNRIPPTRKAQDFSIPTLVVFLDEEGGTVTEPVWGEGPRRLGYVGVNADDLQSLELVSRALGPLTRGFALSQYPVRFPRLPGSPPPGMEMERHHWLLREPGQSVLIEHHLLQLEQSLQQRSSTPLKKTERQDLEQMQRSVSEAHLALRQFRMLARCPLCQAAEVHFESRSDGTYAATCQGCHAQWGTRRCTRCSELYPYLLPRLEEWPPALDPPRNWADEYFGMDLLSLPLLTRAGRQFDCPICLLSSPP